MKSKLMIFAVLGMVLSPLAASAKPVSGVGPRVRTSMFHDRSPKLHERTPTVRR